MEEIPDDIYYADKLLFLNLTGNELDDLPDTMASLENLEMLWMDGNPFPVKRRARVEEMLPNCTVFWDKYF